VEIDEAGKAGSRRVEFDKDHEGLSHAYPKMFSRTTTFREQRKTFVITLHIHNRMLNRTL